MGTLPTALGDLTAQATNGLNQVAGPFMGSVPAPPPGGSPAWGANYTYTPNAGAGTFTVSARPETARPSPCRKQQSSLLHAPKG